MGVDEKYKQIIIRLILALQPDVKIYLFGSRTTGAAVHGSDIDIALDAGQPMERVDVGEVRDVLNATNIPHKIDVVDVHSVPEEMRRIMVKEWIAWKS